MKTINLSSLLLMGTLAFFTVSCRENNNRNDRDDDVVIDDTLGDGRVADGRVDDDRDVDRLGDGRVGDDRLGDGRIGDDRLGDGRIGDDKLGDGRIGDDKLGDGRIGDGDNSNARQVSNTSVSEGRALIAGHTWKVREDLNSSGADERFERNAEFHFSTNGFTLTSTDGTRNGSWSYNGSTLSLRYDGEATSYSYRVLELTEDRMRLQASDGSELTLAERDSR